MFRKEGIEIKFQIKIIIAAVVGALLAVLTVQVSIAQTSAGNQAAFNQRMTYIAMHEVQPNGKYLTGEEEFDEVSRDEKLNSVTRGSIIQGYLEKTIASQMPIDEQQLAASQAEVNLLLLVTAQNQQIIALLHKQQAQLRK